MVASMMDLYKVPKEKGDWKKFYIVVAFCIILF